MAWIKSDQRLKDHPKTHRLSELMKIDVDTAIGRLHLLWYWCLDYSSNGYLNSYKEGVVESVCKIPVSILIDSGFVDEKPVLKIHDWWDYAGGFLISKYKNQPKKWRQIKRLYSNSSSNSSKGSYKEVSDKIRKDKIRKDYIPMPVSPKPEKFPAPIGKIINPKELTPNQKIVMLYKKKTGYDLEDKPWDKLNFKRNAASAKKLLDFFNQNVNTTLDCVEEVYDNLTSKGLSVTLETVVKHAADWRIKGEHRGSLSV